MSDRFKFRVWDAYSNAFRDDFHIQSGGKITLYNSRKSPDITQHTERFVIEQCTGLRDKNGKPIYEGDVVEVKPWRGHIVHMSLRWYAFDGYCAVELPTFDANKIEVVGNVHEVSHA